jgi:hypothetical protein
MVCQTIGCKKQDIYGYEYNNPIVCSVCRKKPENSNMINVTRKRCFCNKHMPIFGLEIGIATHCKKCKTDEMFDVKHQKCFCKKSNPVFGYEKGKATHCKICKTDGMFNIKDKKCTICNIKIPIYGLDITKSATHCGDCKTNKMINVKDKKCLTEKCNTQAKMKHYKGYCAYCFANIFPDHPKVKNYKTKERKVVDYIRKVFPNYDWKFDVIVKDGDSGRRQDIFLDFGSYIIIIEVDENQHISYDCTCENRRLMEISRDVNHRPAVVIRFNPDKYYDKNNKKIPSCFSITKETGALKITDEEMWNERLNNLKEVSEYWIEHGTEKTLEVIQMYYDEN